MKPIPFISFVLLVLVVGFLLWSFRQPVKAPTVTSGPNDANIIVTLPRAGDKVSSPITVTGKARVFERTFNYRLKDSSGKVIFQDYGMTGGPDLPDFGTFIVKIPVPVHATDLLTIEVFEYSAKDGEVTNLVTIPVVLAPTGTKTVQTHFGSSYNDGKDCAYTVPVTRQVSGTREPAFIALSELLKGPSEEETANGAISAIPTGTRLNSLVLRNKVAYVDFDSTLDYNVAGACRVTAIRAQITNTLKQFSSIQDVVISRYGRTDDVLQP